MTTSIQQPDRSSALARSACQLRHMPQLCLPITLQLLAQQVLLVRQVDTVNMTG